MSRSQVELFKYIRGDYPYDKDRIDRPMQLTWAKGNYKPCGVELRENYNIGKGLLQSKNKKLRKEKIKNFTERKLNTQMKRQYQEIINLLIDIDKGKVISNLIQAYEKYKKRTENIYRYVQMLADMMNENYKMYKLMEEEYPEIKFKDIEFGKEGRSKRTYYSGVEGSALPRGRMKESKTVKGKDCKIPCKPGLYRIHKEQEKRPLYVGKASDLRGRLQSHARNPKEKSDNLIYKYKVAKEGATLYDLQRAEVEMIKKFQPKHNILHNPLLRR